MERAVAVRDLVDRQRWNVARAICDHRDQFASRFSSVVVGDVQSDDLGLLDVSRNDRALP